MFIKISNHFVHYTNISENSIKNKQLLSTVSVYYDEQFTSTVLLNIYSDFLVRNDTYLAKNYNGLKYHSLEELINMQSDKVFLGYLWSKYVSDMDIVNSFKIDLNKQMQF